MLHPLPSMQRYKCCVPPCITASSQQNWSTAPDICLHLSTTCPQIDYPSPPHSFAFPDSLGTDRHLYLFPGLFWFSESSLFITWETFQPHAYSPLVKWVCSIALQMTCQAQPRSSQPRHDQHQCLSQDSKLSSTSCLAKPLQSSPSIPFFFFT